jgi:hypothetical protein
MFSHQKWGGSVSANSLFTTILLIVDRSDARSVWMAEANAQPLRIVSVLIMWLL